MRMTDTKFKCHCGKEFDSMFAYSYHFEEGKKKIGKIDTVAVDYDVDGKQLRGQSGKDQLMMEFVADHQILRTNDEEYKRW